MIDGNSAAELEYQNKQAEQDRLIELFAEEIELEYNFIVEQTLDKNEPVDHSEAQQTALDNVMNSIDTYRGCYGD